TGDTFGRCLLKMLRQEYVGLETPSSLEAPFEFNPFYPPGFSPEWRTATTTALARQMDSAGDFSAMPILADALQDAGCDNDDVLNHCRDAAGTHVRGCWVVDGVLGKS